MRVTEKMTTEGGGPLSKLADILGDDEVGVKVDLAAIGDWVRLMTDSTSTRCKPVYLTPDDADALADLLRAKAREARGMR